MKYYVYFTFQILFRTKVTLANSSSVFKQLLDEVFVISRISRSRWGLSAEAEG